MNVVTLRAARRLTLPSSTVASLVSVTSLRRRTRLQSWFLRRIGHRARAHHARCKFEDVEEHARQPRGWQHVVAEEARVGASGGRAIDFLAERADSTATATSALRAPARATTTPPTFATTHLSAWEALQATTWEAYRTAWIPGKRVGGSRRRWRGPPHKAAAASRSRRCCRAPYARRARPTFSSWRLLDLSCVDLRREGACGTTTFRRMLRERFVDVVMQRAVQGRLCTRT